MKLCVLGLWHLGSVTSACMAAGGHEVTGLDFEEESVRRLQSGHAPIMETGLDDLIREGLACGRLRFTSDVREAVAEARIIWVAYDTPVDEEDRADAAFVRERIRRVLPEADAGTLVLISSQLPVGTTRELEVESSRCWPQKNLRFACSPENLRLGQAISSFSQPNRVVIGTRDETSRSLLAELFKPVTERIEWMSVESAEFSKHAINAFLATSVAFANELAELCERVGADAKEVERSLKTEARIGPRAYLSPGSAFAGGTLARDLVFLARLGVANGQPMHLVQSVLRSNEEHKAWLRRALARILGERLSDSAVAVWGLTYKPGTDTLRRSAAVELCAWLAEQGVRVVAHDPAVVTLPPALAGKISLARAPLEACRHAAAIVVATEWPEYRSITAEGLLAEVQTPVVIDPNQFLAGTLGSDPRIRYIAVGKPVPHGS
jgi:UDPglucose 6-dehydrogenase